MQHGRVYRQARMILRAKPIGDTIKPKSRFVRGLRKARQSPGEEAKDHNVPGSCWGWMSDMTPIVLTSFVRQTLLRTSVAASFR